MVYLKETQLVKINYPNDINSTFNTREKHLNVEIQRCIDSYSQNGCMVVERNVINKTSTHATVKFVIQKLTK
jgi:hypothetical protein